MRRMTEGDGEVDPSGRNWGYSGDMESRASGSLARRTSLIAHARSPFSLLGLYSDTACRAPTRDYAHPCRLPNSPPGRLAAYTRLPVSSTDTPILGVGPGTTSM